MKWGGPTILIAFVILLAMDLTTMFIWDDMCSYYYDPIYEWIIIPGWNLFNTCWTLVMGIWLTVSGRRQRANLGALLAWIIIDALLVANQYSAVVLYMIADICAPTLYSFQLVWGKYMT